MYWDTPSWKKHYENVYYAKVGIMNYCKLVSSSYTVIIKTK